MPEYTTESLNMLKSEEGQKNAVFACFGSAAQHAQLLEGALIAFLAVCDRCATEDEKGALRKKTMGGLLQLLMRRVKFDAQWVSDFLDQARERRNWLIHRYFLDRGEGLGTENGRFQMLKELVSIEGELRKATAITNGMRIALTETLDGTRRDTRGEATVFSMQIDVD